MPTAFFRSWFWPPVLPLLLAALGLQVLAALVQVRHFWEKWVNQMVVGGVCVCQGVGGLGGPAFFLKVFFFSWERAYLGFSLSSKAKFKADFFPEKWIFDHVDFGEIQKTVEFEEFSFSNTIYDWIFGFSPQGDAKARPFAFWTKRCLLLFGLFGMNHQTTIELNHSNHFRYEGF